MSDVKKIKRNKIKRSFEGDKTSIFDDGLEHEKIDKYSNVKKINSRKLKNIDLGQNKREQLSNKVIVTKEQEVIYGEKFHKIGTRKLKNLEIHPEEQKQDLEIEKEDNLSLLVMIIILILCFLVGISLGYVLYRIAMNSSNAMFIITHYLH